MQEPRAEKLASLQLGRGLAVFAVAGFHAADYLGKSHQSNWLTWVFANGNYGVHLFFAISGFIILQSNMESVRRREGTGRFLLRRAIRILPVYWVVYALFSPFWLLAPDDVGTRYHRDIIVWLKGWLLMPTLHEEGCNIPHLGVAWTLVHEALFYLLFALLLSWRTMGAAVMALWFSLCAIAAYTQGHWLTVSVWYEIIIHPFNLWFLCGMVGYGVYELLKQGLTTAARGTIHVVALVGLLLLHVGMKTSVLGPVEYELMSAGILVLYFGSLGVTSYERLLKRYPSMMLLGDASYSIYLVHTPIMAILYAVIVRVLKLPVGDYSGVLFMVLFLSALIGGVWFYRRVELPLLNWVRTLLSDQSYVSPPISPVRARA